MAAYRNRHIHLFAHGETSIITAYLKDASIILKSNY